MCLNWPKNGIVLDGIAPKNAIKVVLLGTDSKVSINKNGKSLIIKAPVLTPEDYQLAYVFRISDLIN